MRFLTKLILLIDNFDLEKAEELSIEIHDAEASGYLLYRREDKYWLELTDMIQAEYSKMRKKNCL